MTIEEGSTTMALVGIDADGERNIDLSKITNLDIIHFGSAAEFLKEI